MRRQSITLIALFTVGYGAFLGYTYLNRTQPAYAVTTDVSPTPPVQRAPQPMLVPASNGESAATSAEPQPETVEQLTADTKSDDPDQRAAAIVALASFSKSEAVPVLRQVLTSGNSSERKLALSSLRTLALRHGDVDGGIGNVLREAVYHTDDEEMARSAQATLSEVEQATQSR